MKEWQDRSIKPSCVTAYGVYLLADTLHTSAILAVIVASLILGSYGRYVGMSEQTRAAVDTFWGMIAFPANALLFLLVGMQLNFFQFLSSSNAPFSLVISAALAIVAVLLARFVMVGMLRGLALLRPSGGTYAVVLFTLLVQGFSLRAILRRLPSVAATA